jgi:hypothetical protein
MSGIDLLTNVAGALSQRFASKLARQYNRMSVVSAALPTEEGFGKNVAWDAEFSGAGASSYAEGTNVAGGELNVDALVPATLSWGHYRSAFQVSETEIDAASSSAGSADAILALLEERIMSSGAKLASVINVDLWSGTGTDGSGNPNIVGLQGGALETSGIYAGVNRATYAEWKGNVLANGGVARALTIDLLDQMDANIFSASGVRSNLLVTDPATFRKYKGLFESVRRIEGTGPIDRYDTSTSELFYQGIPILRDKDAPAGTMTFLNTNDVKKVYLPSTKMAQSDVFKTMMKEGVGSNGDGENNFTGLPFKIAPLAKNGDSLTFFVKCVLNLKVMRPNSMGYIKDIATT